MMSVNKQRDAGLPRLHVLLVSLHMFCLPRCLEAFLKVGLQVCSCFFLLNDVFVSSIVPSSFLLLWFEVHLYLWNIFVFKRYNWTKLDFKLVQRVEALEITIQILNQVSTGNKYSKNLPSLTPSSGWRS